MKQSNTKVLVVEDDRPLADVIRTKLEMSGCEVVMARTVLEAIRCLEGERDIELVWLDHYLVGKENGLDLVTRMKAASSPWGHISIIVVSNTASPAKIDEYLRLGVTKYYTKANNALGQIVHDVKVMLVGAS